MRSLFEWHDCLNRCQNRYHEYHDSFGYRTDERNRDSKGIETRNRDIRWQFFIKSLVVNSLGGITGIFARFVIAKVVVSVKLLATTVSSASVIIRILFIGMISLFFGILPAYKDANLNPM